MDKALDQLEKVVLGFDDVSHATCSHFSWSLTFVTAGGRQIPPHGDSSYASIDGNVCSI